MKFFRNSNVIIANLYLIGSMFDKAILFLSIPVFTGLMTTAQFGIVNTYLSWVTLTNVLVGLSMNNSIRNAYIDFKEDIRAYVSSILFLGCLCFAGLTIAAFVGARLFFGPTYALLAVLCLVQAFMLFVMQSAGTLYMMDYRYIKRTLLTVLPNLLIIILSVLLILYTDMERASARIAAYVSVYAVIGTSLLGVYLAKGKRLVDKRYWRYALSFSLPIILHGFSMNILATSDRTMITLFRSASETGQYSLAYGMSMMPLAVLAALESVWIPWFLRRMNNGQREAVNLKIHMFIQAMAFCVALMVIAAPVVLRLMAPSSYWVGSGLLIPIIVSSFVMFLFSIYVNVEYYYKATRQIALITASAAVINVGLNFWLVPALGAIGAAYTTLIAYSVSFLLHMRHARRLDPALFPLRIFGVPSLIIAASILVSVLLPDPSAARWFIAGAIGLGFAVYALRNWDVFKPSR